MIILISGSAGTGKSTAAKAVAKKFKLKHLSSGDLMREIAVIKGFKATGSEFVKFQEHVKKNPAIDKELDNKVLRELSKGNIVSDSRLAPYLFKGKALKIMLKAPDRVAAERNSKREGITYEEALKTIKERNNQERKRYNKLYQIDITDTSVYDLILNTSILPIKEMKSVINKFIKESSKVLK